MPTCAMCGGGSAPAAAPRLSSPARRKRLRGPGRRAPRGLGAGDGPAIVYTGTLEAYQGLELLVAAAPAVVGAVPAARFVVVGGTKEPLAGLAAYAGSPGAARAFV